MRTVGEVLGSLRAAWGPGPLPGTLIVCKHYSKLFFPGRKSDITYWGILPINNTDGWKCEAGSAPQSRGSSASSLSLLAAQIKEVAMGEWKTKKTTLVPHTPYNTSAKFRPNHKDILQFQRARQEVNSWVAQGRGIGFSSLNQDFHSDGKSDVSVLFLSFLFLSFFS